MHNYACSYQLSIVVSICLIGGVDLFEFDLKIGISRVFADGAVLLFEWAGPNRSIFAASHCDFGDYFTSTLCGLLRNFIINSTLIKIHKLIDLNGRSNCGTSFLPKL